jgi:Co/Zn/Cd efflux system component
MGLGVLTFGLIALWQDADRLLYGGAPPATPIIVTAAAALAVNVSCASRLAHWSRGDTGMRSIWLSTATMRS